MDISELVLRLWGRNAVAGCAAMQELAALSTQSNAVYPYMQEFIAKLNSASSYSRTRALTLIAANAKWDEAHWIDENMDAILSHITDEKPITARQFIKLLPELAHVKPGLREDILTALQSADTLRYPPSMRPLVEQDIRQAITDIERRILI